MLLEPRLLFLAIMPFTLVIPILAMALLRKNSPVPVIDWYCGCLCLAATYILISLRASLPVWAGFHLAQFTLISGFCMMLSSYRKNLGLSLRWLHILFIIMSHLMIFSVLLAAGNEVLRQNYVNLISSVFVLSLIYHSRLLERRHHSRGLLLCSIGFVLSELGHFVRLLGLNIGFGHVNPVAPSWDNLFLMLCLLLGTLLINYGYFGYVLERVHDQIQLSQLDLTVAKDERDQAYAQKHEMVKILQERDRLLTAIAHTNRHATLDLLSANVAHEINQPLSAVTLNLYSLQNCLEKNVDLTKASDLLKYVQMDIQRIKSVTQQIRALSGYQNLDVEPVLLLNNINAACGLLKGQFKQFGIKLMLDDIDGNIWVQGNGVLVVQLFLNVLLNAIQALREKTQGQRWVKVLHRVEADHVEVLIEDNGPGLPTEIHKHLFELFQTTKTDGTGLGLPLCQTIIRRLGGQIGLHKNLEGGVTVSLKFKVA